MTEREPLIFRNWNEFMKIRQMRVSSIIFKNRGWYKWQEGHAKLYGILIWHYEMKKQTRFKYSKTLKKQGYQRTHNYRLLKAIVEKDLLCKEGNGYYSFKLTELQLMQKAIPLIKELDMIENKKGAE